MKKFVSVMLLITFCLSNLNLFVFPAYAEENDYIVKFKDDCAVLLDDSTNNFLEPLVVDWNMYKISKDDIEKLDMSTVEYCVLDGEMELMDYTPNDSFYYTQWNMRLINAPYSWGKQYFGRGIRVGVIDSGVSSKNTDLTYCLKAGVDYTGTGLEPKINHGTMIAGVISAEINNNKLLAGLSQADIIPFKVTDTKTVSFSNVAKAINAAISDDYKCDVLNISIGGSENSALETAIEKADEAGVIIACSSGNSAKDGNAVMYPASYAQTLSVGAVNYQKNWASYSEYNKYVDVCAPGGDALSGSTKGNDYLWSLDLEDSGSPKGATGTSFAAPHIAGAAAVVKGIRKQTNNADMRLLLKYSSEDLGTVGKDNYYGYGMLNMKKLIKCLTEYTAVPYIPEYNKEKREITLSYLNPKDEVNNTSSVRAVVYDKDERLISVSDKISLNISKFSEKSITIDNIDIPSGGYAKIFCMTDWDKMIPSSEPTRCIY